MFRKYVRELNAQRDSGLANNNVTEKPGTGLVEKQDELHKPQGQSLQLPPPAPPPVPHATPAQTEEEKAKKEEMRLFKEAQMKQLDELKRQADETMAMLVAAMAAAEKKSPEQVLRARALNGDIGTTCPSEAKIVRIFTSSTFTDTKHERNILMKNAYPRIRDHCRQIGYEFQVVDMRWGVRDEATDDHMGTELCLKELKLCQKVSTGPSFVSLLSHKYGYTPFQRVIDANEFETLLNGIGSENIKTLLNKWYTRDDNCVPPAYVLSSISTHYPDFICTDPDRMKKARTVWWEESEAMQEAVGESACKVFDKETARKYVMSITENETKEGLLNQKDASKHSLWLKRNIEHIEDQGGSYILSRYIECMGSEVKWKRSRQMLKELKEDQMEKALDSSKILDYRIQWDPKTGIDPETSVEHKEYLEKMSADFIQSMTDMIDESVAERKKLDNPLVAECCQHIKFCQTKCENFHGREETLKQIETYIKGNSLEPLVVHGASGTGKTSIMAMAAKKVKSWTSYSPLVVLRFIGTSPNSSSLIPLLHSVTSQILTVYNQRPFPLTQDLRFAMQAFHFALLKSQKNKPLVIFLDSLDQLDPAYDARSLTWLLKKFAPSTKIVVSTLPEDKYECFPVLKRYIKTESNFVDVPVLEKDDVSTILSMWLAAKERRLTDTQLKIVTDAFNKWPTPLFLKLSFDEASTWTSFAAPDKLVLQDTVRASIEFLFQKLEKLHGQMLVSRALSYLTLAHNGATEAELEDILSCDDDVLNDVYMYWTPPLRRLPPLLLVRIKTDLSQYLVERGADGVRVLYWYHRQFIEAAEARYCSDQSVNKIIHANLADFFNGTWANGTKKPYTTAKGTNGEEDRHVSQQPLKYGDNKYNIRALNNLPYHRIRSGQLDLLKTNCLANVNFLVHKLKAVPLSSLLEDFVAAVKAFPEDKLIDKIQESLVLSQKALVTDPRQIVPQLLGRMAETEDTRNFIMKCRQHPNTYLEPGKRILDQPGGQLVHCIAAHKADVDMMDASADGKYALSVCQTDREVIIWNLEEIRKQRSVVDVGQCTRALFCNNDTCVLFEADKKIVCQEMISGRKCFEMPLTMKTSDVSFCVAGKNKEFAVIFFKRICIVCDLNDNGKRISSIIHPEKDMVFGAISVLSGSSNYAVATNDDQYFISVLDLTTKKFYPKFRGYAVTYDEDGDAEEKEVEAIAIFPDETHMAYTSFSNEIIFADLKGHVLRTMPVNEDFFFTGLKFTPDGSQMYLIDSNNIRIYNTQTLEYVDVLEHAKDVVGAQSLDSDMNIVVSLAQDGNVRIWDRRRKKIKVEKKDSQVPLNQIRKCEPLPWVATRYMLLEGNRDKQPDDKTLVLYDLLQDEAVKEIDIIGCSSKVMILFSKEQNKVFVVSKRRIFKLNLETSEIELKFQGYTMEMSHLYKECMVATQNQQLICTSKGGKNLKVYDTMSGKVAFILEAGQQEIIEHIEVNKTGTMACARTDEGPLLLFDIANQKHLYNIPKSAYKYMGYQLLVNQDGTRLIFSTTDALPAGTKIKNKIDHLVVWDIPNEKEHARIYDEQYQIKYEAKKNNTDSSASYEVYELDKERALVNGMDNIIRVHSISNGELLHRLEGHTESLCLSLNDLAPYILSYGNTDEEDCLRIWDKKTYECAATFTLDKTTKDIRWSPDGRYFLTTTTCPLSVIPWKIQYGDDHVKIEGDLNTLYLKLFPISADRGSVQLDTTDDIQPEADDPDTDPEYVEPPDSDDDDDGDDT